MNYSSTQQITTNKKSDFTIKRCATSFFNKLTLSKSEREKRVTKSNIPLDNSRNSDNCVKNTTRGVLAKNSNRDNLLNKPKVINRSVAPTTTNSLRPSTRLAQLGKVSRSFPCIKQEKHDYNNTQETFPSVSTPVKPTNSLHSYDNDTPYNVSNKKLYISIPSFDDNNKKDSSLCVMEDKENHARVLYSIDSSSSSRSSMTDPDEAITPKSAIYDSGPWISAENVHWGSYSAIMRTSSIKKKRSKSQGSDTPSMRTSASESKMDKHFATLNHSENLTAAENIRKRDQLSRATSTSFLNSLALADTATVASSSSSSSSSSRTTLLGKSEFHRKEAKAIAEWQLNIQKSILQQQKLTLYSESSKIKVS
ncbi:MAG: hypothetical protein EXX96DRAFT_85009 [Benjaminiella poitrasii]|nr:MAG: hypothetical protein EXX96DRAFT_85009 [Benjaminiella poitrasii]